MAEGPLAVEYPTTYAEIIQIGQSLSDTLAKIILNEARDGDTLAIIERKTIKLYQYAIERTLNAPVASITFFNLDQVKPWLVDNEKMMGQTYVPRF